MTSAESTAQNVGADAPGRWENPAPAGRPALLRLEGLAVGYPDLVVLNDIQLNLPRASFTGLLGANGSGKSTLLKTILGLCD